MASRIGMVGMCGLTKNGYLECQPELRASLLPPLGSPCRVQVRGYCDYTVQASRCVCGCVCVN